MDPATTKFILSIKKDGKYRPANQKSEQKPVKERGRRRSVNQGRKPKPVDDNRPTHMTLESLVDSALSKRIDMRQLKDYSKQIPLNIKHILNSGEKGGARRMLENFKRAAKYFHGSVKVTWVPKGEEKGEKTLDPVATEDEIHKLIAKYDELIAEEGDARKLEADPERDAEQLGYGISFFRELLTTKEKVESFMGMLNHAMTDGWDREMGQFAPRMGFRATWYSYIRFVLAGTIQDHSNGEQGEMGDSGKERDDDGNYELEYPHLGLPALADAILNGKVNLTAANTSPARAVSIPRSRSRGPRALSVSRGVSGKVITEKKDYLSPTLKWILLSGHILKLFTPALFKALQDRAAEAEKKKERFHGYYTWTSINIHLILKGLRAPVLGDVVIPEGLLQPDEGDDAASEKSTGGTSAAADDAAVTDVSDEEGDTKSEAAASGGAEDEEEEEEEEEEAEAEAEAPADQTAAPAEQSDDEDDEDDEEEEDEEAEAEDEEKEEEAAEAAAPAEESGAGESDDDEDDNEEDDEEENKPDGE